MPKHAPGPWMIRDDSRDNLPTPRYRRIETQDGYLICDVADNNGLPCNRANARLIAAAPDLLYVLRQIIADLPANRDWLDPQVERMAHALLDRNP
jgi:hypothetical protein